jgi:uncharacterized protein (TIGR03083 family)
VPVVLALSAGYAATRVRITELLESADPDEAVAACPGWSVRDVVAHLCGMAEAVAAGDRPGGDRDAWLDDLRLARRHQPLGELLERWSATVAGVGPVIDGGAHGLFVDAVVHEHDLRAAIGAAGARGAPEVRAAVQLQLDEIGTLLRRRGLGALVIDSGAVSWTSHFAKGGCTLRADPWEASRLLANRRTPEEIRAIVVNGVVEPYLAVLERRRPFPARSLGENA